MTDQAKTKGELIHGLRELRAQIKDVEVSKIDLRRAKAEIQQARSYAENIVETVREPLLVLDGDLKVVSVNRSFYQTFKVTPSETLGRLVYDLGNRQWDIPRLRILLEEILPKRTHFGGFITQERL
jgi:PAS domain-containing protein